MVKKTLEKKPVAAEPDPTAEIRSKLLGRLAVAGGLVGFLLAILAFFDYLATPPDEAEARVFSQPVPVAPRKELSQPVTPATNLPEPPLAAATDVKPAEVVPAAEVPAPPAPVASPVAAEESRPQTEVTRQSRARPSTGKVADSEAAPETRTPARSTASRQYALPAPPAQLPSVPSSRVKLPETPSEMTSSPPMVPTEPRSPSARVVQSSPAVQPPSVQRLFSGFSLQAGVFSSAQRAEELHAKLTLSGVPSTLETRVQVGPFRTRQEAEAAQEKLRELGIGTVLVPPKGSKH